MRDIETIKAKYSKYALSLDKLFKNYSLETFKKSLNNPKKYSYKEYEISPDKL